LTIDRGQVVLSHPIKSLDLSPVRVVLRPEVSIPVTVNVARSPGEAEKQARGERVGAEETDEQPDIDTARRLTEAHRQRRRAYVAAPVFGRPDVARAAQLWIVAAGPAEARARVRPLFQAIGRGVSDFGDEPWHANLVKLGNNFLLAAMLEAVGEACALMRKAEIDPKAFVEAANAIFQSPVYANYGGAVAEGRSEPALFKAVLGLKDLRLALRAADELAVPMPAAGVAHDGLLCAVAHGQGDKDWTVLGETARQRAGLP
jgi:3-hydroxyisobutyrate dehydrogenase-like beta-hydroxyacid dehydrogenase